MAVKKQFYHIFAIGEDAAGLTVAGGDFVAAFNRVGICAARIPQAEVVSFCLEREQVHILAYGSARRCDDLRRMYRTMSIHFAANRKMGACDFRCEIAPVSSREHLEAALYLCDGFLKGFAFPHQEPRRVFELTLRERIATLASKSEIPPDWIICGEFLVPDSYLARHRVARMRVPAGCDTGPMMAELSRRRGRWLPSAEAAALVAEECQRLFGKRDPRSIGRPQRLQLAQLLRDEKLLCVSQTAALCRITEVEVRKMYL